MPPEPRATALFVWPPNNLGYPACLPAEARSTVVPNDSPCFYGTGAMASLLTFVLNGRQRIDAVADNLLLLDYLREELRLTGTKTGCDGGECGACTVLVDDRPRLSCLTLAASCEGKRVDTVESLASNGA